METTLFPTSEACLIWLDVLPESLAGQSWQLPFRDGSFLGHCIASLREASPWPLLMVGNDSAPSRVKAFVESCNVPVYWAKSSSLLFRPARSPASGIYPIEYLRLNGHHSLSAVSISLRKSSRTVKEQRMAKRFRLLAVIVSSLLFVFWRTSNLLQPRMDPRGLGVSDGDRFCPQLFGSADTGMRDIFVISTDSVCSYCERARPFEAALDEFGDKNGIRTVYLLTDAPSGEPLAERYQAAGKSVLRASLSEMGYTGQPNVCQGVLDRCREGNMDGSV